MKIHNVQLQSLFFLLCYSVFWPLHATFDMLNASERLRQDSGFFVFMQSEKAKMRQPYPAIFNLQSRYNYWFLEYGDLKCLSRDEKDNICASVCIFHFSGYLSDENLNYSLELNCESIKRTTIKNFEYNKVTFANQKAAEVYAALHCLNMLVQGNIFTEKRRQQILEPKFKLLFQQAVFRCGLLFMAKFFRDNNLRDCVLMLGPAIFFFKYVLQAITNAKLKESARTMDINQLFDNQFEIMCDRPLPLHLHLKSPAPKPYWHVSQ